MRIPISGVIDIGEFRLSMAKEYSFDPKVCKHTKTTAHEQGEYLTCDDCKIQISPYWFLMNFFSRYAEYREKLEARAKVVEEAESRTVVLRAAQKVEEAWRRKKFNPACPHCYKPIGPNDGFGNAQIRIIPRHKAEAVPDGDRDQVKV